MDSSLVKRVSALKLKLGESREEKRRNKDTERLLWLKRERRKMLEASLMMSGEKECK